MVDKLFENVGGNQFRISQENRFDRQNPEGGDITDLEDMGVWDNVKKVEELKDSLWNAMDAGNFDMAHKIVDQIANYHN